MKKILVPTDFSDYAADALRYAVNLAKQTKAEITLIHVSDLPDDNFTRLKQIIRAHNKEKIAELNAALLNLKECVAKDNVRIRTRLYNGPVVDSILTAAKDLKTDIIVMGTAGAKGLKKLLFGSKTAAVINESMIPVIAVPYVPA